MQKLHVELKNLPVDAPQVHCSKSFVLNREETLSVRGKVLACNNLDVDLRQHTGGQPLRIADIVYVISLNGEPLMPTVQQHSRKLIRKGRAKVIRRNPFTIRLLCASGSKTQSVTLGIDAGYSHIGFSAVTEKKELISGEVTLRKDVSKGLTERRMYRKNKRNKLWYREPRWQNRVSTKKKGWLAPSIKHKLDAHISLIEKIKSLLPISKVIVEVASFDTQKMQNPEIGGVEYQQGELRGYEVREYLLEKWGRKCAYCGKSNIPLEIEHIVPKLRGGTNRVSNLTLSCHRCNQKKGIKTATEFGYPEIQSEAIQTLKATAFMNMVKQRMVDLLDCESTYGYITKHDRIKLGLEKSHRNDAFVIASGNGQIRSNPFEVIQKRKNNRCLQLNRKGFAPSIRKQRCSIQPKDLVKIENAWTETAGCHCRGTRIMVNKKSISTKLVESVFHVGTLIWRMAIPLTTKVRESPCLNFS